MGDKDMLTGDEQLCGHCHKGGEEDGRVRNSRLVPYQDPDEASHKGRSEDDVRQGGQGRGEASQEGCEGLPSGSIEETDLKQGSAVALCAFSEVSLPWESHGAGLRWTLAGHGNLTLYLDAKLFV